MSYDPGGGLVVLAGTTSVIDLDWGTGQNPDTGQDVCLLIHAEFNGFGEDTDRPSSYILSLGALSTELISSDTTGQVGQRVEVGALTGADDGDGSYFVVVSDESNPAQALASNYFAGTVEQGDSFEASGSFGSETYVHIFSSDGGALLQTINFHTSCSSPLIIGDQYGSITLEGATLEGTGTGTIYTIGGFGTVGDAGVVYEITGGNDADDFMVDPDTGEVSFREPPDYEAPTDSDGDNRYDVEITAFVIDENGTRTGEIAEIRPLKICIEDEKELGSLSGRYFCDTNDNDLDDGGSIDPGVAGKVVTLYAADAETVIASTTTDEDGNYVFDQLESGDYLVKFEASFTEGKHFVAANAGSNDEVDSDVVDLAGGWTSTIALQSGEDIENVDAGVREVSVQFDKDISNIVAYLACTGDTGSEIRKVKLDDFEDGLDTFHFSRIEEILELNDIEFCELVAVTVKAGNNKGDFGPGEGEFIDIDLSDDLVTGTSDKAGLELQVEDFLIFG